MNRQFIKPHSKLSTDIRVTGGNFTEMYKYFLFVFHATYFSNR